MSLAFYASPFETENEQNNASSIIARKKNAAKTQKLRTPAGNSERVNSLLASIHNSADTDNDDAPLFDPPAPPMSMGVQNTIMKEQTPQKEGQKEGFNDYGAVPSHKEQPIAHHSLNHMQLFNEQGHIVSNTVPSMYGDSLTPEEYYKKMTPSYGPSTKHYATSPNQQPLANYNYAPSHTHNSLTHNSSNQDSIMEKLNYMINLLEENHDERTGNVTEEVVLYSFLGVFIIFIADSFARVGKYTR
jgi:hypothetical protein